MTRWGQGLARWAGPVEAQLTTVVAGPDTLVLAERYEGVLLLRSSPEAVPTPDDAAELARALAEADGEGVVTLVIGMEGAVPPVFWAQLGELLDTLRQNGTGTVRLVLSGAGSGASAQPALAQDMADTWGTTVIAPEGTVLVVPGGSLFALSRAGSPGGWQLFQPGTAPLPLGQRQPAPAWQAALDRLPTATPAGWPVDPVPAGLLVRAPGPPEPELAQTCYGVPLDPEHLLVLLEGSVPATELAALLAELPEAARSSLRLAAVDGRDPRPTAQYLADTLGGPVGVLSGLPGSPRAGSDAAPDPSEAVLVHPQAGPPTSPPEPEDALAAHREAVDRITRAADEGRHDVAYALAAALEHRVRGTVGEHTAAARRARQLRDRMSLLAGAESAPADPRGGPDRER